MGTLCRIWCAIVGHKPGLDHCGIYVRDGRRFRKPDWSWGLSYCPRCKTVYGNKNRRNKNV